MRLIPRTLLGAFLALGLSSAAGAEKPSDETDEFTLTAELELKHRFEFELADTANGRLLRLSGPSTMSCLMTDAKALTMTTSMIAVELLFAFASSRWALVQ